jgi:hypothetical protein
MPEWQYEVLTGTDVLSIRQWLHGRKTAHQEGLVTNGDHTQLNFPSFSAMTQHIAVESGAGVDVSSEDLDLIDSRRRKETPKECCLV